MLGRATAAGLNGVADAAAATDAIITGQLLLAAPPPEASGGGFKKKAAAGQDEAHVLSDGWRGGGAEVQGGGAPAGGVGAGGGAGQGGAPQPGPALLAPGPRRRRLPVLPLRPPRSGQGNTTIVPSSE